MTEETRDPVHRARYAFERAGEDLIVETRLEPGGGLPEHLHPHQEERWSVLEGRVEFKLDGVKRVIGPEDGEILVGRNHKHALAAVDDREAHLRCLASPALDLESFLTDSSAAAREGLFMRGGIPRNLRGARWAADFLGRHRDNVVMSFPPQFAQRAMLKLFGGGSGRTEARRA